MRKRTQWNSKEKEEGTKEPILASEEGRDLDEEKHQSRLQGCRSNYHSLTKGCGLTDIQYIYWMTDHLPFILMTREFGVQLPVYGWSKNFR